MPPTRREGDKGKGRKDSVKRTDEKMTERLKDRQLTPWDGVISQSKESHLTMSIKGRSLLGKTIEELSSWSVVGGVRKNSTLDRRSSCQPLKNDYLLRAKKTSEKEAIARKRKGRSPGCHRAWVLRGIRIGAGNGTLLENKNVGLEGHA